MAEKSGSDDFYVNVTEMPAIFREAAPSADELDRMRAALDIGKERLALMREAAAMEAGVERARLAALKERAAVEVERMRVETRHKKAMAESGAAGAVVGDAVRANKNAQRALRMKLAPAAPPLAEGLEAKTVKKQGQGQGQEPKTPAEFLERSRLVAARADKVAKEGDAKRADMLRKRAAMFAAKATEGGAVGQAKGKGRGTGQGLPKTPEECLERSKVVAARAEKFAKQGDHERAETLRKRAAMFAKQAADGGSASKPTKVVGGKDKVFSMPKTPEEFIARSKAVAARAEKVAKQGDHARAEMLRERAARFAKQGRVGGNGQGKGQGPPKTPEECLTRSKVVAARADKLAEQGEHERASMLRVRAAQLVKRAAEGGSAAPAAAVDTVKLPRAAPLTTAECLERATLLNEKAAAAVANGNAERAAMLRQRVARLTRLASEGDNAPKHGGAAVNAGGTGDKKPKDMTPDELRKRAALLARKADAAEANGNSENAAALRQRVERLTGLAANGGASQPARAAGIGGVKGVGGDKKPKDMTTDELRSRAALLARKADAAQANGNGERSAMLRQRVERLTGLANAAGSSKRAAAPAGGAITGSKPSGGGGKGQIGKTVTPEEAEQHAALSKDLMERAQRAAANGNGERAALLRARSLRQARLAEGKAPGPAPKDVVAELKAKVNKMSVSDFEAELADSGDSAGEDGDFVHVGAAPPRGGLTPAERLIARQLRATAARKPAPSAPPAPSLI